MAVEVVYGESRNRSLAGQLADVLSVTLQDGTVYLGYPVLATADQKMNVDALLVSPDHGLAAFLIAETVPTSDDDWEQLVDDQDRLYAALESNLGRHDALRHRRTLAVTPHTATIIGASVDLPEYASDGFFGTLEELPQWV